MLTRTSLVYKLASVLLATSLFIVSGCASTPNTIANADPDTDFSQFKTFGFFDQLATDKQGYESMESNFLKVAVAQELVLRGLSYSENPDVLVNFYIHSEEKIRSRSVPTTGAYYGYRDPFGYDPFMAYPTYETRIDQYTMGTLNIDVVDTRQQKLVWEGMVSGRITDNDIKNLEKTIDEAVAAIMANFPIM
jgi:hypothetical protein